MKILIGYNGTEPSTAALYDLRYAGLQDDVELVLLTVSEAWISPKTEDEAREIAEAGKAVIEAKFPNWKVKAETASGSPARELLARAESFHPDLIVVGERRQHVVDGNLFVGQTSQTILTDADCSVRIARGLSGQKEHPEKILVGFDGSAGSVHSIDTIIAREWPANTEVRLLAVADSTVLGSIGRFSPQITDAAVEAKFASQWAETLAAESLDRLEKAGITATVAVTFGNPKLKIIEEAEHWDADAIFVGPHCAPNSFERFLLGSVSAAVAARAHCSVEVVRSN